MPGTGGQRKQIPIGPMQLEPHTRRGLVCHFHGSSDVSSHFFSNPPFLFLVQFVATRLLLLWSMIIFTHFWAESQWNGSYGGKRSGLESQFFYYCVCLWTSCLKLLNLRFLMHKMRGAS